MLTDNSETSNINEEADKPKAGRPAGAPNKVTAMLRAEISDIIELNLPSLIDDLALMKPVDKANVLLKLMDFVMPKLKAVEFVDNTPKDKDSKFGIQFTGVPTGFQILTAPNSQE